MKFVFDKGMYTMDIISSIARHPKYVKVKLDTGSPVTILKEESIEKLVPSIVEFEREMLMAKNRHPAKYIGVGGGTVSLYPIKLKLIQFEDTVINNFICYVYGNDNSGNNLIGCDFITSCSISKSDADCYIELCNFDQRKCIDNFVKEYATRSGRRVNSIDEIFSDCTPQQYETDLIDYLAHMASLAGKF